MVNRGEILFLYEVRMSNPNGDPADENKPRIDEETGRNIVTDVRLKRTIRDYIDSVYGNSGENGRRILVKAFRKDDGTLETRKEILERLRKEYGGEVDVAKLAKEFFDVRVFGLTMAGEGRRGENVRTLTGPVQFRFGISLNEVEPRLVTGTSVWPTKADKAGGSFTSYWIVPYSLIGFYGVVNETVAADTGLDDKDLELLREAMWEGTKWLSTRSKHQFPRLLIHVEYEHPSHMVGDLGDYVELVKKADAIRSVNDYALEIGKLLNRLEKAGNGIKTIYVKVSEEIKLLNDGRPMSVDDFVGTLSGIGRRE